MIGKEPDGVSLSLFYNATKDTSRRKVNCKEHTSADSAKVKKSVSHILNRPFRFLVLNP